MRIIRHISSRLPGFTLLMFLGRILSNETTFALPALPTIPPGIFNVMNYGAVPDGKTFITAAMQKAVDAAIAAGGGTVEVPAGDFLCGPFTIGSNIRLQLDAGAKLLLPPYGKYPGGSHPSAFIIGKDVHDLEFCGPGLLDGQGSGWWTSGIDISHKPYELHLINCTRVYIHDWTSINPPMKHIVFDGIDQDITVDNVTNTAPYPTPNTDCLNLQGSHCLVRNCVFSGGDDNIAMGRNSGVGTDILITNITCGTGHGISIGSITTSGVSNVTVVGCSFTGTDNGIRLKADNDRGGTVQNINYENIRMTNVQAPIVLFSYYTKRGPNKITPAKAAGFPAEEITSRTPVWRNITISNVTSTYSSRTLLAGVIWGRHEMFVSNVTLSHVNISAPSGFNIYNARGIRFIDSQINTPAGSNSLNLYNADVTISNRATPARLITIGGLDSSNAISLRNVTASLKSHRLFGISPITLDGSTITNNGDLELPPTTIFNFVLGQNNSRLFQNGDLLWKGNVIYIASAPGFAEGSYPLVRCVGAMSGSPSLGQTPAGYDCSLDTNTPGQILLVAKARQK